MTARQIISARLGRDLGPLRDMPDDLRLAVYLLARQLANPGAQMPVRAVKHRRLP